MIHRSAHRFVTIAAIVILTSLVHAESSLPAEPGGRALADRFVPFTPDHDRFQSSAVLDLRSLNEAFAGEHGFVQAKDGHLVFSKNQASVRFWAVNGIGVEADKFTRDAAQIAAKTLAKRGVNLVRIHGPLFDDNGNADPVKIQRAIATVEELKMQGIYSYFSIYFPVWITPKPDNAVLKGYDGKTHPFAALMFNPDFQKQYQSWWTALLTTPSDKTGKRLIYDPAVAGVEIQNEDSLFFWTFNDKNIPETQLRLFESQFADFFKNDYTSLNEIRWLAKQRLPRDNPAQNRIAFRPLWNIANERTDRDIDTAIFLLQTQENFYYTQIEFLRKLGFKGLISASNWITADAKILGPLERYSYRPGDCNTPHSDLIDHHGYLSCNHKGDNAAWSIRNGHTYFDRSALRFDPDEPDKPRQYNNPIIDVSYNDSPTMISEIAFDRPNRYRSEAPLFLAAYASLQNTSCIVHFAFDSAQWHVQPNYYMQPWTLMSPASMGQFPAAALLYRKGLIKTGDLIINLNLRGDKLRGLQGGPLAPEANFDELRLKDVPRNLPENIRQLPPNAVIDPLVHFVGRTNINFIYYKGDAPPSTFKDTAPFINRSDQSVTSSTGQLALDYGRGILTINAPAVQGISGNLKAAGSTTLKDVTITSDLDLVHIILVALDDKPLATSSKILLQAMTEEKPTNFRTEPTAQKGEQKILDIGKDPWQIREIQGTVRLNRPDAAALKITPLDPNGNPLTPLPASPEFQLQPTTLYYLITK
ncbi:MAG: hypothetical protein FWD61_01945 [Phycisphaerales bacterium]|nr:hypothetical protein [Phycisphaerales bacterium]